MSTKLLVTVFLCFLVCSAVGLLHSQPQQSNRLLRDARQCRLQRISASKPSQKIESEGGVTELWDEYDEQFQCAGVAAIRNTIQPNSLSLPNFHPFPRLVYIERGQGLLGLSYPGCPETFHSRLSGRNFEGRESEQQEERRQDSHQKVRRIRQGDIVALPPGVAHWCYNDGNEELVAVSVNDLNHQSNQLDQQFRAFYLAGGVPREGQRSKESRQNFYNILSAFDAELMADAFNVPVEIVKRMQQDDERGLIVNVTERMSVIIPDEEQEQQQENGLEETICSMRIHTSLDNRREADVYSREAGKINIVNQYKLPILQYLDMSAEKGNVYPRAIYTPNWSMNGHSILYVTRGDAEIQVVNHKGQTVLRERVNQGDMFVIPQYFAATGRAGENGFEYVAFKTTGQPMKSPIAGYTSVFRALPLQVITNSYRVSSSQAQDLKLNSGEETLLLSPRETSRS